MPQLRLVGLVLFITSVFLGMAAATTHTTHIRFKRLGVASSEVPATSGQPAPISGAGANPQYPAAPDTVANQPVDTPADKLQFVAIPVIYPLTFSSILGLLLWFVPAPATHTPGSRRRRRRRRH